MPLSLWQESNTYTPLQQTLKTPVSHYIHQSPRKTHILHQWQAQHDLRQSVVCQPTNWANRTSTQVPPWHLIDWLNNCHINKNINTCDSVCTSKHQVKSSAPTFFFKWLLLTFVRRAFLTSNETTSSFIFFLNISALQSSSVPKYMGKSIVTSIVKN